MKTMSIKEFAVENNITDYVKNVRTNVNGYCYVTFVNALNEGMNIYLSRKLGETINAGDSVADMFKEYECAIFEVTNADGEIRVKIGSRNESLRGSIEDLF
jgi:hypothetical protein